MCMSVISCWSLLLITGISEVGGGWGDLGLRLGGKAAEMRLPKPVALGKLPYLSTQRRAAPSRFAHCEKRKTNPRPELVVLSSVERR
jgi:hypothetical protein